MTDTTFYIVDKLAVKILLGTSFTCKNILRILPQSEKVVSCNSKTVSILVPKILDEDVNVVVVVAFDTILVTVTTTKMAVELRVARKTWLISKTIGRVNITQKGAGFLYFNRKKLSFGRKI